LSIPTAVFMNKRSRKTVIVIILLLMGIAGIAPAQFMTIAVALITGWPFHHLADRCRSDYSGVARDGSGPGVHSSVMPASRKEQTHNVVEE